jgi:hypothetical protein
VLLEVIGVAGGPAVKPDHFCKKYHSKRNFLRQVYVYIAGMKQQRVRKVKRLCTYHCTSNEMHIHPPISSFY